MVDHIIVDDLHHSPSHTIPRYKQNYQTSISLPMFKQIKHNRFVLEQAIKMPTSVISSAQSQVTLRRVVKAGRSGVVQRPLFANCVAYAAMGFNKQQISTGMSTRSQVVMVSDTLHSLHIVLVVAECFRRGRH